MINRGLRTEKPSKVKRNVPNIKLANIKSILTTNQLSSRETFNLDKLGSSTMPKGGFMNTNFKADENLNLSHRIHQEATPKRQPGGINVTSLSIPQ